MRVLLAVSEHGIADAPLFLGFVGLDEVRCLYPPRVISGRSADAHCAFL